MPFDRVSYKERGKEIVKANFWILVLACFVANLLGGQSSFNSGGISIPTTSSDNSFSFEISGEEVEISEMADMANFLAIFATIFIVIFIIAIVYSVFVGNIMLVGKKKLFLENVDDPNDDFSLIFNGFTGGKYMQRVKSMFIYHLTIFLWSLLFVIPGIIAAYKYYLVPYIIADNPDIDIKRAKELSAEMTNGHKFDIFVMELSFLGWALLGACCTCGILGFWLNPYMESSFAVMYTEMKVHAVTNGYATADELGMNQMGRVESNNDYKYFN